MSNRNTKFDYQSLWYAIGWFLGNSVIGLAPILFLIIINPALDKDQSNEISHHLKSGILLFVCCALMGDVIIEIIIEKISFNRWAIFTFYVSPFIILVSVCFMYLLKLLGHLRGDVFSSWSNVLAIVIVFTTGYCVSGKYRIYNHHRKAKTSSNAIN